MKKNKKVKVTLLKKVISQGKKQSLYLDFYPPILDAATNKYTRREFLKIYLYTKPRTTIEKIANDENLHTAGLIQIKRQNEVSKDYIYSAFEQGQLLIKETGSASFMEYFENQAEKRTGSNYDIWITAMKYFSDFLKGRDIVFSKITVALIDDYKEYLLNAKSKKIPNRKLAVNTAHSYFSKVRATLKKAYKDGMLQIDVNAAIETIKEEESQRNFLHIEEAQLLYNTDCEKDVVKRVCLFAILTGLRYSDIEKLKWSELEYSKYDGYTLRIRQQKTSRQITMPISEHAVELMGEPRDGKERVFESINKWDLYRYIPVWMANAGISKHITFHCFRHTYATLQLNLGTDIFTVSKMLGHKNVKTTQIYTKIIDKRKRETTDKINLK